MDIFATIAVGGVPVNGLVDTPEIRIRDDANTVVQAFTAMTDQAADGKHVFAFVIPDTARSYTFLVDADPNVTGQVPTDDRFYQGSFSGEADIITTSPELAPLANLDVAVSTRNSVVPMAAATSQAEHDNTQLGIAANLAAIAALNNLSIADVQAALDAQGYTAARAILLDNLDATISSRNAVTPMTAALSQTEHDATQAAIAALNNLSSADVTAVLDAQGYTAARALLLDNLDVAVSSRAVAGDAMALTGATLAAVQALIITDATPFQGADVPATLLAVTNLRAFIEGGRDIDFTGNDALGWQRIERDVGGTLIRRYNLFDENGARINETVSQFIGRQGMISAEVAI